MNIEPKATDNVKVAITFTKNDYLALKRLAERKRTSVTRVVVELCANAIDAGFAS